MLADTRSAGDTDSARSGRARLLQIAHGSGPKAVADDVLAKLLGPTSHRTQPQLVARVRQLIEAQDHRGNRRGHPRAHEAAGLDATPRHSQRARAVLVGKEDVLTPPDEMERMAAAIPQARFVVLAGAGHLSNIERPDAFNDEVRGFLAALNHGR